MKTLSKKQLRHRCHLHTQLAPVDRIHSQMHQMWSRQKLEASGQLNPCEVCGKPATWASPTGHYACDSCRARPVPIPTGTDVIDMTVQFLNRFIAYPSPHARLAHALWIIHCHLMDAWESTPRIAFLSPEPGSGKTRALEITEMLVPNPVEAVNVTPAYLFRKVGDDGEKPTVLFDEIDTVFGPKAKDNEEIRGLLNAGHRRGAVAGRCVVKGRQILTEEIPAYCAVALAGIGELPDTLLSRSIVVRMRRRAPGEKIEPFRHRTHGPLGEATREVLADWAGKLNGQLSGSYPQLPPGIEDRNADVWEPLIAIADAVGGVWPEQARSSAVALVADLQENTPSLGIKLLADLQTIFGIQDQLSTETIIKGLTGLDESPWNDLYGKALNARGLAQRLRRYEVQSKNIRVGAMVVKGYTRETLQDVWNRYLPSNPLQNGEGLDPSLDVTPVTLTNTKQRQPDSFDLDDPVDSLSPDNTATSATPLQAVPEDDPW